MRIARKLRDKGSSDERGGEWKWKLRREQRVETRDVTGVETRDVTGVETRDMSQKL